MNADKWCTSGVKADSGRSDSREVAEGKSYYGRVNQQVEGKKIPAAVIAVVATPLLCYRRIGLSEHVPFIFRRVFTRPVSLLVPPECGALGNAK